VRSLIPHPILLVVTLLLVAGAIAFIELHLDATGPVSTNAARSPNPPDAKEQATAETTNTGQREEPTPRPSDGDEGQDSPERTEAGERDQAASDRERIYNKEREYRRAEEIVAPSGFVNADGFSIAKVDGEKVVLLEFWTYTCFNCQNVQPHINSWYDEYTGDGLQVVGVHTPEFGFEREYANVEAAVREAGIEYPVVLDNAYATWNAYDNRYWPAIYLIDADGFVRYKHFGEGAYGETQEKIEELLAERAASRADLPAPEALPSNGAPRSRE
jgi:thiol-disulfide isomerase/thioredoxin